MNWAALGAAQGIPCELALMSTDGRSQALSTLKTEWRECRARLSHHHSAASAKQNIVDAQAMEWDTTYLFILGIPDIALPSC